MQEFVSFQAELVCLDNLVISHHGNGNHGNEIKESASNVFVVGAIFFLFVNNYLYFSSFLLRKVN